MSKHSTTPKVIADPVYGITDIRPVLPMVETEEFQALADKRQLGMASLTFPSATHSRKAHSLGAYRATRDLADRWIKEKTITKKEGDALAGYALYHDVGHPALSHVTEPLCPRPEGADYRRMSVNSALSLAIIRRRRREIEACGIDFGLMEKIARHENPLHLAVSDKNLGMEKLDYLERDGLLTILSRPVGIDYLRQHIYFEKGALTIDEKVVDNAIEAQNYYLKIYKNVYLRKTSAIAQRMIQKMVHRMIAAGELRGADLVNLTDSELFGLMRTSRDPLVIPMYSFLRRRELYREAVVIRPAQFAADRNQAGKAVVTFAAGEKEMKALINHRDLKTGNQNGLAESEAKIEALAGIPSGNVLIVPVVTPERFDAQDILIHRGAGKRPASLRMRYPAHFRNIEEVARTYLAFRVTTIEKYRRKLSSPAVSRKVLNLLRR